MKTFVLNCILGVVLMCGINSGTFPLSNFGLGFLDRKHRVHVERKNRTIVYNRGK